MTEVRLPEVEDFPRTGPNALATIGQRGVARAIDEVVTSLPMAVVLVVVLAPQLAALDPGASDVPAVDVPVWVDAVAVALGVAYETLLVGWRGQTLGKMAMGIRVARYNDGRHPDWGQAAMRVLLPTSLAVALLALGLPSLLVALVYLTAITHPMRRGWHDLAGGTVVVRTR